MMYKAVCDWRDLTDNHLYHAGDEYPYDGRAISDKRIDELLSNQNKAHKRLIEAVRSEDKETINQTQKPAKKAVRSRKKTV